jgi:signal transduction histidine kinase
MLNRWPRKRKLEQEEFMDRELHDGTCQYVIAARMALDHFRHEKAEAGLENWSSFDTAVGLLDHAIEKLRRLVHGLYRDVCHRRASALAAR